MSKYYIEIHCGFKVAEFVEKIRNCKVTKEVDKALKFTSKKSAQTFINEHDGDGLNKKTARIVEIVEKL